MTGFSDASDTRTLRRWLAALVAGGGFLVFASYIQLAGSAMAWPAWVTLNSEMTVGAWWSAGLLLLGALVTFSVARSVRVRGLPGRWAMVGLGVVLTALAIDEFASLHERFDDAKLVIPRLLRLPPIAALIAATLAYTLWETWKHRGHYGRFWLTGLIIGFGCMGSVYGIELLEHRWEWPEAWRPARMAIEEGLELFGMGVLLMSLLKLRVTFAARETRALADRQGAWTVGVLLAVVTPALIVLHHLAPPVGTWQHWGWPGLAGPSLLMIVAAFAAYAGAAGRPGQRGFWYVGSAALLAGSLETAVALKSAVFSVPIDAYRPDLTFLALGALFVGLGLAGRMRGWWLAGLVVAAMNLVGLAVYKTPIAQLLAFGSAGLLLVAVAPPNRLAQRMPGIVPLGASPTPKPKTPAQAA